MRAESLTECIVSDDKYFNRKKQGRLSILVDLCTKDIHIVPKDKEHIEYAAEITADPKNASYLVPSHIDFDSTKNVRAVTTGVCGLEQKLGVRHSSYELQEGNRMALEFVRNSPYPLSRDFKSKIDFSYLNGKSLKTPVH